MNNGLKYGLFFLGGLALGVVGTVAVTRGKLDLKPLATDLVSRGMDMKDAIMSKVEAVKEDMEDLAAEARAAQKSLGSSRAARYRASASSLPQTQADDLPCWGGR